MYYHQLKLQKIVLLFVLVMKICVTEERIVICVNLEHLQKVKSLNEVIEEGMLMFFLYLINIKKNYNCICK